MCIFQEEHSKVFSQLNFVLMLAELLSDLAVSCGAPIAALMDNSHGQYYIITFMGSQYCADVVLQC